MRLFANRNGGRRCIKRLLASMLLTALAFAATQQTFAQVTCTPQMRAAGYCPTENTQTDTSPFEWVCMNRAVQEEFETPIVYGTELAADDCTYEKAGALEIPDGHGTLAKDVYGFGNVHVHPVFAVCVYEVRMFFKTQRPSQTEGVWVNRATGYVWAHDNGEWRFDDDPYSSERFTRPSNPQCEPFPTETD